jgi:hypothetical protein
MLSQAGIDGGENTFFCGENNNLTISQPNHQFFLDINDPVA